jgi:hypothetical protein
LNTLLLQGAAVDLAMLVGAEVLEALELHQVFLLQLDQPSRLLLVAAAQVLFLIQP